MQLHGTNGRDGASGVLKLLHSIVGRLLPGDHVGIGVEGNDLAAPLLTVITWPARPPGPPR